MSIIRAGQRLNTGAEKSIIEVGGGPLAVPIIALTASGLELDKVKFIDLAEQNLNEVRNWVNAAPNAFDFKEIIKWIQSQNSYFLSGAELVRKCRDLTWSFSQWDMIQPPPAEWRRSFDVVSSHFFAESATNNLNELRVILRHIEAFAAPGAIAIFFFHETFDWLYY